MIVRHLIMNIIRIVTYIVSISVHKGTVAHYYHVLSMSAAYSYVVISRNIIGTFPVIVCINYIY